MMWPKPIKHPGDQHWYSSCEDCGLFCTICGALWPEDRPLSEATFTVPIVSHWHHMGTLNGPRETVDGAASR